MTGIRQARWLLLEAPCYQDAPRIGRTTHRYVRSNDRWEKLAGAAGDAQAARPSCAVRRSSVTVVRDSRCSFMTSRA
jgi:hypothetical protein